MKTKKIFATLLIIFIVSMQLTCFAEDNTSTTLEAESEPELYSEAAILIEATTGKVLYNKNANQKMYPASLTKIMTAIITIENCDLDEMVTVNYNAISTIPYGYSTAELIADEKLTVKQLLEVLLIHSANDAANVLAMHVGGSIDSFVNMMNSKAQELGANSTNFTNAYGLHDENHYSTANDLALIAKYCMENSSFRSFVSEQSCTITSTNKHDVRTYNNTNDLIRESSSYYYEGTIGIKTGYTKEAKNCLISAVNKNGFETIGVVLGAGNTTDNLSARYVDSKALYDYAYSNYTVKKVATKDDVITQTKILNGTTETKNLEILISKDITALVSSSYENSEISPTIRLDGNLSAPISKRYSCWNSNLHCWR